jgi:hypothetical protein
MIANNVTLPVVIGVKKIRRHFSLRMTVRQGEATTHSRLIASGKPRFRHHHSHVLTVAWHAHCRVQLPFKESLDPFRDPQQSIRHHMKPRDLSSGHKAGGVTALHKNRRFRAIRFEQKIPGPSKATKVNARHKFLYPHLLWIRLCISLFSST